MKRTLVGLGFALAIAGCSGGEEDKPTKGTVTISVSEDGAPMAGAYVLFHTRSGALIEQFVTPVGGVVTFDGAHVDGSVTVFGELAGGGGEITTIGGLDDGDDFDVNLGVDDGDLGAIVGEPDVVFDGFPGTSEYELDVGCLHEATTATNGVTAPIYAACTDASGDADLFAVARDNSGAPLAYAFVEGFDAATTNSVQLPTWSTTWTDAAVEITGLPANAVAILSDVRIRGRAGAFSLNGEDFAFGIAAGGVASATVPVAQGMSGGVKRTLIAAFGEGITSIESASVIFQDEDTLSADLTLPFATEFFPPIGIVENVSEDEARPQIEWEEVDLTGIDAGIINVEWDGASTWTWGYFVPPDLVDGSIRFPALPDELVAMLPAIDPSSFQFLTIDADYVDGFDEVKALQDFDLENPGVSPSTTKMTLGGSAVFGN